MLTYGSVLNNSGKKNKYTYSDALNGGLGTVSLSGRGASNANYSANRGGGSSGAAVDAVTSAAPKAPTFSNTPSRVSGSYSDALSIINGGGTAGTGSVTDGMTKDVVTPPATYTDVVSGLNDAGLLEPPAEGGNADISGGQETTSYIDSNGEKQTGTVGYGGTNSGATVSYGSENIIPIDTSAVAEAAGAGTSTSLDYLDQLLGKLESTLQQQLSAADSASAAATQQAINKIRQQIENLNQQYKSTNKQLYADYMLSKKNLPQQLSALGYTGGLTESSLMGLDTGYGAALAGNERNRLTDVSNLESGITDAELEAAIALAEQKQSISGDYFTNYSQVMQAIQEQKNYEAQLAQEKAESDSENALYAAQVKAQYGDFTGIAEIYGADVAAAMKAEYDGSRYAAPEEEPVSGYENAVSDITQLVNNNDATSNDILRVINAAVSAGGITAEQGSTLRRAYVDGVM